MSHGKLIGMGFAALMTVACESAAPETFVPITTRAELDAHLAAPTPSALDCLSDEARWLFVKGLDFGENGLTGYRYPYLSELTPDRKAALLSLFETDTVDAPEACGAGGPRALSPPSELAARLVAIREDERAAMEGAEQGESETAHAERLERFIPSSQREALLEAAGPWAHRDLLSALVRGGAETSELELLFARLSDKGLARAEDAQDLHRAYVNRRDFAAAERFRLAHPEFDVPTVTAPASVEMIAEARRVLVLSSDGMLEERAVVPGNYDLIVFSSPRCGFCRLAAEDIAKDDELLSEMGDRAIWVSHPMELPDDPGQIWWSETNPELSHLVAYRRADWPEAGRWATPTFLLMDNGQIVDKITGWAKSEAGSNLDTLRDHLGL